MSRPRTSQEPEQSAADLGRRVKHARVSHDLTLETASRLCGVSRSALSKIKNGLMSPTFDVLQKIMRGLRIDLAELFGTSPAPSANGRRGLTRRDQGNGTHIAAIRWKCSPPNSPTRRCCHFVSASRPIRPMPSTNGAATKAKSSCT